MKNKINYFVGIDVQVNRGCCYYILDENKKYVSSGWMNDNIAQSFRKLFMEISDNDTTKIAIGIDAPRMPLKNFRRRSFNKKSNDWIDDKIEKIGRECEVIIKSFNIANPQWTRTLKDSPDWMKLGYSIYKSLKDFPFVYEVFPSASYGMLKNENVKFELCLNNFAGGVKDMLDASVAAITVYEFINFRGGEVGGEDGLGTIILHRKFSQDDRL